MIACMRCSIIRIEMPRPRNMRITSIIRLTSVGLRPASTSSSNSSNGRAQSARASSSRFLPAIVSWLAGSLSRSARPTTSATSRATRCATSSGRFSRPKHAPTMQFSSTLIVASG
jgi:hypothetical protein